MRDESHKSMKSISVIPTIVPDSFSAIEEVSKKYAPFTSFFQIDLADGKFAPNTTWLPTGSEKLPTGFEYEVHMMVADPREVGLACTKAGAHTLIGHVEAFGSAEKAKTAFSTWKDAGASGVGVAILLDTSIETLDPYLPEVDFVLFMTIAKIGVMGFPFEERSIARIAAFHAAHPEIVIAVDGGVSEKTIERLAQAGATRFGVGSAISKAADQAAAYQNLKTFAERALQ